MLTVLSIAYSLAAVSPDAGGGSEQVLSMLDEGIVAAGHRSLVVARQGSRVAGELLPVPCCSGRLHANAVETQRRRHAGAVARAVVENRVDIVHAHGLDFHAVLPRAGVPVLVTLHCPPVWYPPDALRTRRPATYFNAVSARQHAALAGTPNLLAPVENGVRVAAFATADPEPNAALVLGRVAPEKGIHIALDAAREANVGLTIAGPLDAYPDHVRYFDTEVAPRLGEDRRWIGAVGFERKRRLLAGARCLLICSEVEETSSLVAREAIAAGTPVIAVSRGALVDVVEHERTGFLVRGPKEIAAAIERVGDIDREVCRATARERFDSGAMVRAYLQLYEMIAGQRCRSRA